MGGITGKGGGGGSTTTTPAIPQELSELFQTSSNRVLDAQNQAPLTNFTQSAEQIGGRNAPFQTSARAGQFSQAQNEIGRSQQVAGQQFGEPTRTGQGVATAQSSQARAGLVPGTFSSVRQQAQPRLADIVNRSDRQITGQGITADPAYQQAIRAFESTILPQIQNSAAQSGLGRSTGLQQSIAAGQAQYLLPVIQDTLARQERSLDRGLGARQFALQTNNDLGLQLANAQERGIGRTQAASQFLSGQQQAAGAQGLQEQQRGRDLRFTQSQNAIGQLGDLGQSEQAYTQGALDRNTQDFLRRQALAEQSLFTPFGGAASSIGQNVQSTQGGKKGK